MHPETQQQYERGHQQQQQRFQQPAHITKKRRKSVAWDQGPSAAEGNWGAGAGSSAEGEQVRGRKGCKTEKAKKKVPRRLRRQRRGRALRQTGLAPSNSFGLFGIGRRQHLHCFVTIKWKHLLCTSSASQL